MNRDDLQAKIRTAARHFTDEVTAIFGEAFASVAVELRSGQHTAQIGQQTKQSEMPMSPVSPPPPMLPNQSQPVGRVPRLGRPPSGRGPGRPPGAKDSPGTDRRNRRSAYEIDRTAEDVFKVLASTKTAMRVEEINKRLGTDTKKLMRPIQKLLKASRIKKGGERRATVYFL